MRVAELEAGRSSAVPALEAGLRSGPIRAAARRLRELIGEEGLVEDRPYLHPSSKAGVGQQCGDPTMRGNMLIPASVQDIAEHLRRAAKAVHPEEVAARGADAAGSLRRAVAMVAKWRNRTASARRRRLSELRSISRSLRSESRRLMREFAPEHILEAEGAQRAHPALWAAVCSAFEMDPTLAIDAVLGVRPVGDVPSSGMFAQVEDDGAYASLDELDHDRWNTYLESDIRSRSLSGRVDARDVDAVFAACEKEVAAGHMHGYFSKEELDARFGVGAWRAIRRFGVWQNGKCRACDNCAESLHNLGTRMHESLRSEAADLPARVAGLFAAHMELDGSGCELEGGTDDIESAYRRIMCAWPQFTVVAIWHPVRRETVFMTLPGLNFGLKSAVVSFNRFPLVAVRLLRELFGWTGGSYFDDFVTVEPRFCDGSGQIVLREVMEMLGLPVSAEKHVPLASVFVFLGVQTDFRSLCGSSKVWLGVTAERQGRLRESLAEFKRANAMTAGEASKMAGRLGFATSWAAGKFGRAVLQPLFARAAATDGESTLDMFGLRGALDFFEAALVEGLPPRAYDLDPEAAAAVQVWTDAMWEPGQREPARVAFVVRFPAEDGSGKSKWLFGARNTPEVLMRRFVRRKNYIGQLELLAAVAVYYSVPELRGRRVLHWIDNTGVIAALTKGYSRAPDSVRILHVFKAFCLGLGVSAWFQWVPSKANIADLPSRNEFDLLRRFGAVERRLIFPEFEAWDGPVGRVLASGRLVAEGLLGRGRKRGRGDR